MVYYGHVLHCANVYLWLCCSILILCVYLSNSGTLDPACVLEQIENQILKVKEEAFDRNEILEKVDRWLAACEEECWLEEYNRVTL